MHLSTLGLGTYLGPATDAGDAAKIEIRELLAGHGYLLCDGSGQTGHSG